ncbi:hypothetical protein IAU60_001200 [Kwoniella sp. DSM 27419]
MPLSYLVSTAGHAQSQNEAHPHEIRTVLQLIQQGAQELDDEKVVGFTTVSPDTGRWTCQRLSYPELLRLSAQAAAQLNQAGVKPTTQNDIISLLCPTGLDFLVAWMALMRMGYGVVFIAPQCSPSAIDHLITSSSSTRLVYHPKYVDLATAGSLGQTTVITQLPTSSSALQPDTACELDSACHPEATSHIFHTSGTSGTPKPIPNTHGQSVSVLPRRAVPSYLDGPSTAGWPSEPAAFTTTPLFHGGVSDLLRGWMARSVVYFYPTSDVPITSTNVLAAVEACDAPAPPLQGIALDRAQRTERENRFKVASFLSVPYILSTLAEDASGPAMAMLRRLDYVSTGGAPLDTRIGDRMVDQGIRLVSRLGSSECGFLLSSHRDYTTERDWEWLRNDSPYADALRFEAVDGRDEFEMVVTSQWSSKTRSNRDDGSYATGDLYRLHPTKPQVWRYAGRGDDVIVMSNGEKAAPGPIESTLRSSSLLADALVVGADRPQLGLLLFPKGAADGKGLLDQLRPLLEEANAVSPSFAQISMDMCAIVPSDQAQVKSLPKSSKGTIQRGVAYEVFKQEIEKLYDGVEAQAEQLEKRPLPAIEAVVQSTIDRVCSSRLKVDSLTTTTDLFAWGVDSLMATRIRSALVKDLNTGKAALSNNVVFEQPSIERLARYIYDLQEERDVVDSKGQAHQLMQELATKYGAFEKSSPVTGRVTDRGKTVVLTGGTGSLGAFLIHELVNLPPDMIERVICLVRAPDDQSAGGRIATALGDRALAMDSSRVVAYASDLSQPTLGLTGEVYRDLVERVDHVVHAAWPVHFASSLISFEDNIKGTRHLIDLVAASPHKAQFHFCSSLASVLALPSSDHTIREEPTDDPATASSIGYSQSKWVTEKVCRLANESVAKDRVHILRVGQLCGDTKTGRWNEKEGWPLMIRTAQTTGCLPLLDEKPSWLPVDQAAKVIVDLLVVKPSPSHLVYHVAHPDTIPWNTILDGLQSSGMDFQRVPPRVWLDKVRATSDDPEENPSKGMLSMWQAAYGVEPTDSAQVGVDTSLCQAASPTLRDVQPVGEDQITLMVQAWRKSGFLRQT